MRSTLSLSLLLFCSNGALLVSKEPSICLNMIVKNERAVIERCLNSVKPLIDYWVIVDTGSSDGTQEIIRNCLENIPGELHEKPWINFEHNRNEALLLAKNRGDYLLFMDADETLLFASPFLHTKSRLDQDCYFATFREAEKPIDFSRILLVRSALDWSWKGVVHEQITCPTLKKAQTLSEVSCLRDTPSSARSQDPQKYRKDAKLLEEELKKDPDNSRNVFYLAQSYSNAEDYPLALQQYEKRSIMKGDLDELFLSLFMKAKLQDYLQFPFDIVVSSYNQASRFRPYRAEPLFYLGEYLIRKKQLAPGYALANHAMSLSDSYPKDRGYIEFHIYDYASLYLTASTAFALGKYEEAQPLLQQLSQKKNVPLSLQKNVQNFLSRCLTPLTKEPLYVP